MMPERVFYDGDFWYVYGVGDEAQWVRADVAIRQQALADALAEVYEMIDSSEYYLDGMFALKDAATAIRRLMQQEGQG